MITIPQGNKNVGRRMKDEEGQVVIQLKERGAERADL